MKSFLKFIATLLLTGTMSLGVLIVASKIFVPKWIDHEGNRMTYIVKGYYEEKNNSLDVVFMGNSDTYRGIDPMAMYHEYGFTSYNFVSAGQRMWIAKAMFDDSLLDQTPKVIMFNVDGLYSTNQANIGNHSKVYSNMRFSISKVKNMLDLSYRADAFQRIANILPILQYHSRYTELTSDDFKYAFYNYHSSDKGMDMVAYRIKPTVSTEYMQDKGVREHLPSLNIGYLDKMREICEKKHIRFVLFHTPSIDSASYARYMGVKEYADKYNLDYIELNFDIDKIGIDWDTDTSDGGDHLNMFGAEKTSIYLGKILKEKYNLPDHRQDKDYAIWNKDYEKYLKQREKEIEDAKALGKY